MGSGSINLDTSTNLKKSESPVLDQARQRKAREYSRRRRLSFLETGVSLVLLVALIFSGASQWFTGLFHWPVVAVAAVYFVVLMLGFEIITFPLSYYRGFVLSHRYGISIQTPKGWLVDLVKGGVLGLVFGSAAVAMVYWFLLNYPDFWWLAVWGLMLVITILMTIVTPVFLVPIFFKTRPLDDQDLKSRLEKMAQRARAKVKGIYTLDFSRKTTAANAALMGMGRTRRIVISDTLIRQYTAPEIEVVTAHEIGHHINRDIWRLFIIQSAVYLIGFKIVDVVLKASVSHLGFNGISDPAALPWLVLIFGAFSVLVSPLMNSYTRHVESQADGYALKLTEDPKAFVDAMTRLANQNLAVAHPSLWEEVLFHDHPSYNKRVEQARLYEEQKGTDTKG